MAQRPTSDFNIDPNITSGTDLANILNRFQDAIDSGNSGTSRPAYLVAGGLWVQTGNPMRLFFYDGTKDNELYNTTEGIVVDSLEDGTAEGQVATWNQSNNAWTSESNLIIRGSYANFSCAVGIGTDSPQKMLEVSDGGTNSVSADVNGTSAKVSIGTRSDSTGFRYDIKHDRVNGKAVHCVGSNGSVDALTIDALGEATFSEDVVVGTNNDQVLLHSDATVSKVRLGSNADSGGKFDIVYTRSNGFLTMSGGSNDASKEYLSFGNNSNATFFGNVGIGMAPLQSTAKEQLEEWKSRFDAQIEADPKADKKALTLEITDDAFEVLPTEAELAEWMAGRAVGDALQVQGSINASGTVKANQFVDANGPIVSAFTMVEAFRKIKSAVADETTVEGIKESLTNVLGGLIEEFESIGTQES